MTVIPPPSADAPAIYTAAHDGSAAPRAERIEALDILRGFALFGMLLVHFHQRTRLEATGLEDLIGWYVWMGVEQKAWAVFAFLFGVGFAVLLRRLEARGMPVVRTFLRRLAVLAAIGIVVEVATGFAVLFGYAVWGVVLLFIRNWSTPALFLTAVASAAARPVATAAVAVAAWLSSGGQDAPAVTSGGARALRAAVRAAEQGDSYVALLQARWAELAGTFIPGWIGVLPDVNLALFILGLLALRHGVLDRPLEHRRLIVRWGMFGFLAWATAWLLLSRIPDPSIPRLAWPVHFGFGLIQDQWLAFTFIGALVLLLATRPRWQMRLALFGAAGRMALTAYVAQAILFDWLASGYGLGLKLRPYHYVIAAMLLFGGVALASRWWLRRYRYGPLEWVWRSLTYGRAQPMRGGAARLAS